MKEWDGVEDGGTARGEFWFGSLMEGSVIRLLENRVSMKL